MKPPDWMRVERSHREGDKVVYRIKLGDDPALGPDAARWTPEDETWHAS